MPSSGLAFSPRQLQGCGKGPLAHTHWQGLGTPRLELPPRGWKVLWQPPQSSGRAGAEASAFPPPFAPCSSGGLLVLLEVKEEDLELDLGWNFLLY